jgi:putative aldouronate transport system substrate-binding protein
MYMDEEYPIRQFPPLALTPEEKAVYDAKWPAIETYIKETTQNWTMGGPEKAEAEFDNYMAKLKNLGIEDVIRVYQAGYDRYYSAN